MTKSPRGIRIGETKRVVTVEDPFEAPEAPADAPEPKPTTEPVPDPEPARVLAALRRARLRRDKAEEEIAELVVEARNVGVSWADIGVALGTTRASAWERWHGLIEVSEVPLGSDRQRRGAE